MLPSHKRRLGEACSGVPLSGVGKGLQCSSLQWDGAEERAMGGLGACFLQCSAGRKCPYGLILTHPEEMQLSGAPFVQRLGKSREGA